MSKHSLVLADSLKRTVILRGLQPDEGAAVRCYGESPPLPANRRSFDSAAQQRRCSAQDDNLLKKPTNTPLRMTTSEEGKVPGLQAFPSFLQGFGLFLSLGHGADGDVFVARDRQPGGDHRHERYGPQHHAAAYG